jgi:hypothetical protein
VTKKRGAWLGENASHGLRVVSTLQNHNALSITSDIKDKQ